MAANQSAELSHYNLKRVTSRIPSSPSLSLSLLLHSVIRGQIRAARSRRFLAINAKFYELFN